MKGLALIMGMKKGPMGKPMGPPSGQAEPDADESGGPPDADADDSSGGSEMKFAKLAADALADDDTETAADALRSLVKACMSSYGGK